MNQHPMWDAVRSITDEDGSTHPTLVEVMLIGQTKSMYGDITAEDEVIRTSNSELIPILTIAFWQRHTKPKPDGSREHRFDQDPILLNPEQILWVRTVVETAREDA